MPYYCFKCDCCSETQEICCSFTQRDRMTPSCSNGLRMRRDYQAEQFGGIQNKSKGIYPLRCENLGHTPVDVGSYQEHQRILKSKKLVINEPTGESRYKRKHARDLGPGR